MAPYCEDTSHEEKVWLKSNADLADHVLADHISDSSANDAERDSVNTEEALEELAKDLDVHLGGDEGDDQFVDAAYFKLHTDKLGHCLERHGNVELIELVIDENKESGYFFCAHCFGHFLQTHFPVDRL